MVPPDDGAQGDIEELEEIEELDDVELIEEEPQAAAPPPPPPSPPPPPTPPAVPRIPEIPAVASAQEAAPEEAAAPDVDYEAGREAGPPADEPASPAEVAAAEPAGQPLPKAEPLEAQLEIPTVIDLAREQVRRGDVSVRVARLVEDLEHADSDRRRAGLIAYELGELQQRYQDDEAAAVKAFDRALRADPTLRPNLWAIRRLIVRRELWPKLVKLLDAESRIARSDAERADLLVEKGFLLQDKIADRDAAKEAFEKATALDPTSLPALMSLERIAVEDGDDELRERVLRALVDASANPGRKLSYLLDLIALKGRTGASDDELAEARQLLVEAVSLAPEAGASERVARERIRLAELSGDPGEMLGALEARIANVRAQYGPQGPPEPPKGPREPGAPLGRADELRLQIVALRRRQARVARDSGDGERAWGYLEQALALAGGEPLLLADLSDLAERLGKYAELAELCRGWESLEGDSERSLALSLRRAEALLRGGQREQAEELLGQLSASAPGFLPITALRERDALAEGDWAALAETYREAGEAALLGTGFGPGVTPVPDHAGAAAQLVSAGDLYASYVSDFDRARALYEKALEAQPGYAPAVEGLSLLLERTGKADEAAALLELSSESGHVSQQSYVLERLTRIYTDLGRLDDRLGALRRQLALDPDNLVARWRIDETLAELGDAGARVDNLCAIAERVSSPDRKAAILLEAARLADMEAGDAERATALYRKVLELSPGDRFARSAMVAMLRRAGRWSDLVSELTAQAAQLEDGPAVARALREAAGILRDRLDQPGKAVELYRQLVERVPDDRFALLELADALAAQGDSDGLIDTLEALVGATPEPAAQLEVLMRQGAALEAAGRREDAIYAYRRAAELAPGRPLASLAAAELAAAGGDAGTEVELLGELAQSRGASAVQAALWEEVGWRWALALEDYDRAAEAFERALEIDRTRRSAAIGASLAQSKRGESAAAADALAGLAETLHGAYAASALLLRSAAIAEAAGDADIARARVARAAATAPDDAGTLVVSAEYLPADITGELPDDGGAEQLIQRASVCAMRAAIASDPAAGDDWELDQAELLEAAGRLAEAGQILAGVLAGRPDDVRALQLLRRVCARAGNREGLARASVALARVLGDREGKLALFRQAAHLFDRELDDPASAVPVYRHLLREDPGAPELDRLLVIYRQHDDVSGLIEVLGERLNWIDQGAADADWAVPLLAERGALRARIGDSRGAIRDLVALLELAPDHADGLRLLARLRAAAGDSKAAASLLQRFLEVAPDDSSRAEAELALSEILAEDMDDLAGAIAQLEKLLASNPAEADVRERIIGLCLKAGDWQRAIVEIREAARHRSSNAERARDQLRIAGVLRDRLADPDAAIKALERARQLDPLNVDAVRELAELVGEGERNKVLGHAGSDIRAAIAGEPARAQLYERLSVISRWLGDADARYFAVSALGALSTLSSEQKQFIERRRKLITERGVPSKPIGQAEWAARLSVSGQAAGYEIWAAIAEGASKLIGLDAARLGFGRGDRVSMRSLERDWPALASLAKAYGAEPDEVYVSDGKPGYARSVSGPKPMLFLGTDVARADSAAARFSLGRALAMVREGTGTLAEVRPAELTLLFAAAANLANVGVLPEPLAGAGGAGEIEERARELSKAMSRRDRKSLPLLASRFGELGDPTAFRRAALTVGLRAGMLACGDIDAALDVLDVGRGARAITDDRTALDLLAWAVSDHHLALRALEPSG